MRRRTLAAGEVAFRQGDRATAIFRVEAGRFRLVRHLEDGAGVALHVARVGETFAEAALFAASYHCDAVAEVESVLLAVPKADLLAALTREPEAALGYARHLGRQVRDLRAQLELRNIRNAPQRLLAWLHLHASGDPPVVMLDRPWTEIAPELGLTHEAVYRALAALQKARRIRRNKDMIRII
ncbi:Crp/Fnr family transcriptional regulator [Ferrovibrio xuzhouensis]|uniref:Crp/Fnr family transcriptional regulator n=1 Tax=Ferrovibrio xuzhouensis TaxID=1576914 RepID=A0ABV7VF55_9PROT